MFVPNPTAVYRDRSNVRFRGKCAESMLIHNALEQRVRSHDFTSDGYTVAIAIVRLSTGNLLRCLSVDDEERAIIN